MEIFLHLCLYCRLKGLKFTISLFLKLHYCFEIFRYLQNCPKIFLIFQKYPYLENSRVIPNIQPQLLKITRVSLNFLYLNFFPKHLVSFQFCLLTTFDLKRYFQQDISNFFNYSSLHSFLLLTPFINQFPCGFYFSLGFPLNLNFQFIIIFIFISHQYFYQKHSIHIYAFKSIQPHIITSS